MQKGCEISLFWAKKGVKNIKKRLSDFKLTACFIKQGSKNAI